MIKHLLNKVSTAIGAPATDTENSEDRAEALRLATAVLMIDVARADHVFDETEFNRVLQLVESHFELDPQDAAELVNLASDKADDLTSAYEFTSVLHKHLDDSEKTRIVGMLWQIAYADGDLDKYEDSLVLKISDLLHVSRARVMRLKHDAQSSTAQ
ncbi:MAG: TerB family tellurite resistance protein [Woeseiaceae bacterium]